MEREYPKGYFQPQSYETSELDDMHNNLRIRIGANTAYGAGKNPQIEVEVYKLGESKSFFWINLDKIDEVITALAWAKHRMEEETRGEDSSG